MNNGMILYNALIILRDLANYLREENISITTARAITNCETAIDLPSEKIAYIAGQAGIAGGLIEAVYNAQMLPVINEAIDWLTCIYSEEYDIKIEHDLCGRAMLEAYKLEL